MDPEELRLLHQADSEDGEAEFRKTRGTFGWINTHVCF